MKIMIELNATEILDNMYSEEELLDLSTMESIYCIRKLKGIALGGSFFVDDSKIEEGNCYVKECGAWYNGKEWSMVSGLVGDIRIEK